MSNNNFEPTTCSDCSYPANFVVTALPAQKNREIFSIKCRDCGDIWEESADLEVEEDESDI